MPLLWLLLALPLVELFVFIQVGARIGALATIALSLLTAGLGLWLVQRQGLGVLIRVYSASDSGELPAIELMEGALILIAGLCLLIPGFITDILGLLLLIPALRRGLIERSIRIYPLAPPAQRAGSRVIEGEFWRED